MMIPNRFFYSESFSKIPNLYQLRSDTNSSHFTGLRLLNLLYNRSHDKASAGFIDAKYVVQKFENDFDLKIDCENNLNIFLGTGVVEANNRLEEYGKDVDQIKITSLGVYLLEYLTQSFTYLDLICLDCGIFDEEVTNLLVRASSNEVNFYLERKLYDRVMSRLGRVEKFIDYLIKQENQEFTELGIPDTEPKFAQLLKKKFDKEKIVIIKSAGENT